MLGMIHSNCKSVNWAKHVFCVNTYFSGEGWGEDFFRSEPPSSYDGFHSNPPKMGIVTFL